MERWQGKVAVVTGASSGIGAAVVKDLVEAGMKVVGLARRKEKMEDEATKMDLTKGGKYYPKACDVSKEQEILNIFSWIKSELGGIDVLVNNAGVMRKNMLTNPGNSQDLYDILNVNVMALCFCTREAFNSMKERDVAGHIIHINSITGHNITFSPRSPPIANMYPGSKYCVTALTEILRQEMIYHNNRTKITSLSPGFVVTGIMEPSFGADVAAAINKRKPALSAEDVSQALLYVLGTPEHVQVHELTIKPVGELY